MFFKISKSDVT